MLKITRIGLLSLVVIWGCSSSGEPKDLVIWHTESDPATQAAFRQIGDQLEQRHPGLSVQYQYIPWDDLSQRLTFALTSNDPERSLPDITHLEPYMAYGIYKHYPDALVPITDVVHNLEKEHGEISPAVRDLQLFDSVYYGIAQHVGVSFIVYRKDILQKEHLAPPKTWDDFFKVLEQLRRAGYEHPVAIPGSSPFFMEAIFSEYLSSAGGNLLTYKSGEAQANLNTAAVSKALSVFARMSPYLEPQYRTTSYVDQFRMIGNGDVVFVMFVGARATKTFEDMKIPGVASDSTVFAPLMPPVFESDQTSGFTSLDAEPWVILRRKKDDPRRVALAKEWMELFYSHDNYMKVTESVPIQLIPIFLNMRDEYSNNEMVRRWAPWYRQATTLIDGDKTAPYFMQTRVPAETGDLFDLHNSGIPYALIMDVISAGTVRPAQVDSANTEIEHLLHPQGG